MRSREDRGHLQPRAGVRRRRAPGRLHERRAASLMDTATRSINMKGVVISDGFLFGQILKAYLVKTGSKRAHVIFLDIFKVIHNVEQSCLSKQ